jgi:transposase
MTDSARLKERGLPVHVINARHAKAGLILKASKTDRNDARGLAQLMRTGFRRGGPRLASRAAARLWLLRRFSNCAVGGKLCPAVLLGEATGRRRR